MELALGPTPSGAWNNDPDTSEHYALGGSTPLQAATNLTSTVHDIVATDQPLAAETSSAQDTAHMSHRSSPYLSFKSHYLGKYLRKRLRKKMS